jgi:hypothetical protein
MKIFAVRITVVLIALSVCLAPVTQAAEKDGDDLGTTAGLGAASFLCSLPYGAVKVAGAVLGGVVGGFTYLLSGFDKRAADSVWYTTMGGDYIVTPDHLRGRRDLRVTGVPPESRNGR